MKTSMESSNFCVSLPTISIRARKRAPCSRYSRPHVTGLKSMRFAICFLNTTRIDPLSKAWKTLCEGPNATEFYQYARRLAEFLRSHIYKEDKILFEIVDRSLSKEEDGRIVAEFDVF